MVQAERKRAVAYIRVSSLSQVDGHSLDAQKRLFHELCKNRGWTPVTVYREEGKSAHSDSIKKRPELRRLLEDSAKNTFDLVVVHTLDRWSRNQRIMLETLASLGSNDVALISITENIDYSTPQGMLFTQMLGSFAQYFSDSLGTHVSKGLEQRAVEGKHTGGIPFGFESCWAEKNGERKRRCKSEHPGGVHPVELEAAAVIELFRRYAVGTTTLATLAGWLNDQGLRTRNRKKLPDGKGGHVAGPRLFTNASVRNILHNPFYTGKVRHRDQLLPGAHDALVSDELFQNVQQTMKRNSGRSSTLHPNPQREYLLKGLIRCADCGLALWAQTFKNGHRYYREQRGSRGAGYCVGRSGSMPCQIPDEQMGQIISAILLPESWVDRILAQVHLADEVKRVDQERVTVGQRLRRLGTAYVDGLYEDEEYRRQKRLLDEKLQSLVVPDADVALEAGKLLEHLPGLWKKAGLSERRRILITMLDAVYVDTVDERRIVAIRPKPAFRPLFEIATTREGSGIVLVRDKAGGSDKTNGSPPRTHAAESQKCSWWRRGRVERYREHGAVVLLAA